MTRFGVLIIVAALGLSACNEKNPVLFDGEQYKAKIVSPRDDKSNFTVTVRDGARNLDAAQRAGRYAAVIYCTTEFGSSSIKWGASGTVAPDQLIPAADGTVVLEGQCIYR